MVDLVKFMWENVQKINLSHSSHVVVTGGGLAKKV